MADEQGKKKDRKKMVVRSFFSFVHMPEVIFTLRQEMANYLRDEAGRETNPEFARRLRALAACYEVGQTGESSRDLRG